MRNGLRTDSLLFSLLSWLALLLPPLASYHAMCLLPQLRFVFFSDLRISILTAFL
jgi:hypothetical protein